jgi:hypothetical protein
MCRRLIQGAFSGGDLPDYLVAPDFYKFSPAEELISLPADIARTEFRLVATLGGWEHTVCERALPGTPDPQRRLLVTVSGPPGCPGAALYAGRAGGCVGSQHPLQPAPALA